MANPDLSNRSAQTLRTGLLAWYDENRRELPWRAAFGERSDPYRVWLSEIMLQQTTVATAKGYFKRFLARWPDLPSLARAPLDEVLKVWAGLGYYARARNLHACARDLVARHGGRFPDDPAVLMTLPGIGPYTAAAIAAIAFNRPANVVDGNIERVIARLFAVRTPLPTAKPEIRVLAQRLSAGETERPGDFAQAMMDLGAMVCRPGTPICTACPWRASCGAHRLSLTATLPARAAKAERPLKSGVVFWISRDDGAVLVRRRPGKGLLGGMSEFPTTQWRAAPWTIEEALAGAPALAGWRQLPGLVRHVFSHFALELTVIAGRLDSPAAAPEGAFWVAPGDLGGEALPSVMRKIADHAARHGEAARGQERPARSFSRKRSMGVSRPSTR